MVSGKCANCNIYVCYMELEICWESYGKFHTLDNLIELTLF